METQKNKFFTKERVYNVIWYVIGCLLVTFILSLRLHIKINEKMITYFVDNLWKIFFSISLLIGCALLIFLKLKHTIDGLKTEISNLKKSIKQSTDNHAQHIYYIEKYYMENKKYSKEDRQKEVPFGIIGDVFGYFKDKTKE